MLVNPFLRTVGEAKARAKAAAHDKRQKLNYQRIVGDEMKLADASVAPFDKDLYKKKRAVLTVGPQTTNMKARKPVPFVDPAVARRKSVEATIAGARALSKARKARKAAAPKKKTAGKGKK